MKVVLTKVMPPTLRVGVHAGPWISGIPLTGLISAMNHVDVHLWSAGRSNKYWYMFLWNVNVIASGASGMTKCLSLLFL